MVLYLKQGLALEAACREAFHDLGALGIPTEHIIMSMVALDRQGNHCAVTTMPGRTYVYQTDGMQAHAESPRLVVEL